MDLEQHAATITELQAILASAAGVDDLVQSVASAAAAWFGSEAEVTVTLHRQSRLDVVASSGTRALACDEAENKAHDGPCVEAALLLSVVKVPAIDAADRWPAWRATALENGFRSAAAFPAVVDETASVALNVYSDADGGWIDPASERAALWASEIARISLIAVRMARHAERADDLQAALASRSIIDQALGVVMAQNRCAADEAFAILSSASQHRNVKMRDLATSLVASVGRGRVDTGHAFVERAP